MDASIGQACEAQVSYSSFFCSLFHRLASLSRAATNNDIQGGRKGPFAINFPTIVIAQALNQSLIRKKIL